MKCPGKCDLLVKTCDKNMKNVWAEGKLTCSQDLTFNFGLGRSADDDIQKKKLLLLLLMMIMKKKKKSH